MLLDVLFEPNVAPHCELIVIRTPFIIPEREVRVAVPTVNSLLGDKLTAFAPRTIGILYDPKRKTDIAKQLFDVGILFDAVTDLGEAAEVYAVTHARQLVYRKAAFSLANTLNDSMQADLILSQFHLKGEVETEDGKFLYEGIFNLANHLVNSPYRHADARVAASKAPCTAAWILRLPAGMSVEQLRYQPARAGELCGLQIRTPWASLTRLKGGNPEAFHYWYQAQRILNA